LLLFLAFSLWLPLSSTAQVTAPEFSFETYGVVSSSGTTPFWLQSNRHGMFASNGSQLLTRIQAHSTNNQLTNNLILSYGADFIARPGTQSTASFNQGYVRLDAWGVFLQAGRFHNRSPIHGEDLSMGSLGVSGNAPPIPQIRAGLADWTSLPFTRDFIQIKGHLAHGWLGSRRFTDDVLYHEKVGHARFGGDFPLNLYGGLAHYALWGGNNHPVFGDITSSLSDFGRVFVAVGGDDSAPSGDENYILGDHRGGWDFGFFLELDALDLKAYRNFPLETKSNLKLKSLQDALTGIDVSFSEPLVLGLTGFVYEFLYTKWQAGPRREDPIDERGGFPFEGNENYYNNGLYQTGWAYQGRTIGNPLFIPRDDNRGIENNRIVAHHIGMSFLQKKTEWQIKGTYSRNYGTWGNPFSDDPTSISGEPYDPPRNQLSGVLRVQTPIQLSNLPPLNIVAEIGVDSGDLVGNQIGGILGFQLNL